MVRVNLVEPSTLADQHLIAEYREILLLFGYYKKHNDIKGSENNLMHPISFYKDKLLFLIERFNLLKEEMKNRGFKPKKTIELNGFEKYRYNNWEPKEEHIQRVKNRIIQRLNEKPNWYRYYGEYKTPEFFEEMMK